jgi:hypothetical protein
MKDERGEIKAFDNAPSNISLGGFPMTGDSPIVEEMRERRRILSERYGHNLQKYYEHLQKVQSQYASRLVNQITVIRSSGRTTK